MSPKSEIGNQKSEASSFRRLPLTFVLLFLIWTFCLQTSASASCFSPAGQRGGRNLLTVATQSGYCIATAASLGQPWCGSVGNTTNGLVGWWKLDESIRHQRGLIHGEQ